LSLARQSQFSDDGVSGQFAKDRAETLRNRSKLSKNRNLLYWYGQLYRDQFRNLGDVAQLAVLAAFIALGIVTTRRFRPALAQPA